MAAMKVVQQVIDVIAALGIPGTAFLYMRDRRKNRAAARVAEGSVYAEISTRDTAALDAHVAYVERAFETERKSMDREIKRLQTEVRELRAQIADRDLLIDSLRDQVGQLTHQMQALQDQLNQIPTNLPPPRS